MGLLDSMIGSVAGQLLGGGQGGAQGALLQAVIGMLNQPGSSGLGGLLQQFNQAGLGDVAASWVSKGQNLPVSASQIQDILGSDMIGQIAGQLGTDQGSAAGQLAQYLPQIIDAMTPDGQMPAGNAQPDLGALLGKLLG